MKSFIRAGWGTTTCMRELRRRHAARRRAMRANRCLLARVQQHDMQALDVLYDRYSAPVYTIALWISGDHAIAMEVIVRVFQDVWESTSIDPADGNLLIWLTSSARHYALAAIEGHVHLHIRTP